MFFTLLGGATVAWPLAARAQQPAMPVISAEAEDRRQRGPGRPAPGRIAGAGYLSDGSPEANANSLAGFRKGLSETGYVEGRNVEIEFRYARIDQLPQLAADLLRRRVAVIAAVPLPAALAAKAATATIPIVFMIGVDPVKVGLVASFNRPGGNATGMAYLTQTLAEKRLGLLHALVRSANVVAVLINPNNPVTAESGTQNVQAAASLLRQKIEILHARNNREIHAAFASLAQRRADALLIIADSLFTSQRVQVVTLAARHGIPAIYTSREFAEAGGLMSYGANLADVSRQFGIYTGRVLNGEKPSDLPVVQPTKFEFVINLNTARALGIDIPPTLLAIADEVIE